MSDLHPLPLIGHDLPEYVRNEPVPQKSKVFVRRNHLGYWTWHHWCGSHRVSSGLFGPHQWGLVLYYANNHAEECC